MTNKKEKTASKFKEGDEVVLFEHLRRRQATVRTVGRKWVTVFEKPRHFFSATSGQAREGNSYILTKEMLERVEAVAAERRFLREAGVDIRWGITDEELFALGRVLRASRMSEQAMTEKLKPNDYDDETLTWYTKHAGALGTQVAGLCLRVLLLKAENKRLKAALLASRKNLKKKGTT